MAAAKTSSTGAARKSGPDVVEPSFSPPNRIAGVAEPPEGKLVEVTLKQTVSFGGVAYEPGTPVRIPESAADRLRRLGCAE